MDYKFEKLKYKHINECIHILGSQWDLGKTPSKAKGDICAKIYMLDILIYSTKIIVCTEGNNVVGFAGYYKYNDKKYFIKRKIYQIIQYFLYHSKNIKYKEKIKEYYKAYNYRPDNLKQYFTGELSILILKKDYTGKGIGSKLFNKICEMAKEDGINKLAIDAADSCNWDFYKRNNCEKIYETEIETGEKLGEKTYIFEKIL